MMIWLLKGADGASLSSTPVSIATGTFASSR